MITGLLETLLDCETRVWQALVDGDAAADKAALDPDFLGVYSDGFSGRAEHAGQLADGPTVTRFALTQARVLDLAPGCAVLSYFARYRRVGRKADEEMYVSSIWRLQPDGTWCNLFSQDTPALD